MNSRDNDIIYEDWIMLEQDRLGNLVFTVLEQNKRVWSDKMKIF